MNEIQYKTVSIGIFYFSGTGNTKAVTYLLAKEMENKGCHVDIYAIDEVLKTKDNQSLNTYDVVGFGYPVHAFNAPRIFFEFVNRLPAGNQKKTFVFRSAGDPFLNGGATALVRKALQNKGYDVCLERMFVMPANVLIRYRDPIIKHLYTTAVRHAKTMTTDVLSGTQRLQSNTIISTALTAGFSSMERIGARFFGKHLTVVSSCNHCGICIKNCPTKNITEHASRILFGSQCTFCMRCIYGCPVQAIVPRFLKFLVIRPWFDLEKIGKNPSLQDTYITQATKGYFRHFHKYVSEGYPSRDADGQIFK
ncbi:MAG TPA: EFR1 family ferrodoxin [Candidatus Thermoplasmatota archaeon]|nr:EFR1 family ferrodoxin [Candidatus Thermoplasmatota archaeon]